MKLSARPPEKALIASRVWLVTLLAASVLGNVTLKSTRLTRALMTPSISSCIDGCLYIKLTGERNLLAGEIACFVSVLEDSHAAAAIDHPLCLRADQRSGAIDTHNGGFAFAQVHRVDYHSR